MLGETVVCGKEIDGVVVFKNLSMDDRSCVGQVEAVEKFLEDSVDGDEFFDS